MNSHQRSRSPIIICFSNLDWGCLRYRKQHLMSRLAAHLDVVYVNPPRAMKWKQVSIWNRLTRKGPNLWVFDPIVLPGIRNSPRLKDLNYRLIARALKKFTTGGRRAAVWIYSPHAHPFVQLLEADKVVYDIADNYTVPSGAVLRDAAEQRELNLLAQLEQKVLASADLVLCVSEPLVEMARSYNHNVHLVPNACDFESYATIPLQRPHGEVKPRVGYVGTVAPRFDVEMVFEIARRRADWDIEMVGPFSPLVNLPPGAPPPNLVWRGEIPYDRVAEKIQSFDICILPLREIPFSYCSSPIQVWDYLAAGKPVISTPIAQLERIPEWVTTASGAEEFVAAIDTNLRADNPDKFERRRRFARQNTWESRVERILGLLKEAGFAPGAFA
jgi:glycosyltransferase involved in cell wall biosynthesis